ncbi:OVARIAN TUMOR DOMAIN-containing deubiquitinating enzyme 12-like [Humulus lupulus]|uniref:OVARIAN TUMOR DOMAIN-containing deubiquitinating enzyme 12-like n=1 Tax=Humulus lupulus TaxID=3486 RepID=UPI002B4039D0|nr:OVARIAN TUMOR DOMAIN-containing deubiquitinating enzyme 12-like [Humulus lupulus]XP_062117269.1 OVARIAN TUMOR DOMAIN-containing deubiquitinating enzyme 12-like [Humulus lupulus]
MAIYEQSDFLQSCYRLFSYDEDLAKSYAYYRDGMIQNHSDDIYHKQYYDTESNNVENDEIIAHALQEEFSRLDMEESSGYSHVGENHSLAPVHTWQSPPRNYSSGNDCGQEESNSLVPSTSSSSSGQEEYVRSSELDEYSLDDGANWNLDQITVPFAQHVPRINGEIPSIDEATSDHQRLLDRLQSFGFIEHKVQGDGNCQFRALSDQLYDTPDNHKNVRRQVVNQLKSHSEIYEGYVPMAYDDYLEKMSKSGEWGDHVTLQAAADAYGVKIIVMASFKDTKFIEILPKFQTPKRVIYLSFWAEVHYNSIYPQQDTPSDEFKKKRKWWKNWQ